MRLSLIIVLILLTIPVCLTISQVEAAESYKGKAIGVVIEKSCLMSEKCIKYKDIISLDNSNKKYFGDFVEKNDDIVRKSSQYQNNIQWLKYEKNFIIMVDPPVSQRDQLPLITIVSSLDEYHLQGQMKITEYKTTSDAKATFEVLSSSNTRYVDKTCTNAIITAKNWKAVLPDTINYLRNNCDPKQTQINTISNKMIPLTKHDITTSWKYKEDKWKQEIIKNCIQARNACTNLQQPTRAGL